MPSNDDDKNSVCSEKEELEVKDKEEEEENDEEEEVEDDEDEEQEDEDDDNDEDDEFDPSIIQFELLKNFLVDEEGTNIATHMGAIAHELRRLNKILSKK